MLNDGQVQTCEAYQDGLKVTTLFEKMAYCLTEKYVECPVYRAYEEKRYGGAPRALRRENDDR